MHPIIEAEIMKTRTAEAHRRADQARLAGAGQGRRALRPLRLPQLLPSPRPWPAWYWLTLPGRLGW